MLYNTDYLSDYFTTPALTTRQHNPCPNRHTAPLPTLFPPCLKHKKAASQGCFFFIAINAYLTCNTSSILVEPDSRIFEPLVIIY